MRISRPTRLPGLLTRGVIVAVLGVLTSIVALPTPAAEADTIRNFSQLFNVQTNGSIQTTGNTLMTCSTTGSNGQFCAGARDGSIDAANNDFTMVRLDADSDSSTTSSSRADVTIPTGGNVLSAHLFWGASTNQTGSSTIKFRTPASGYQTLTSDGLDRQTGDYSAYRDVTALVRAGGAGSYWGADAPAANNGGDLYAGWSLVVVVADPNAPLRDLSVFSGYAAVGNNQPAVASIAGFRTPPTGTVRSRVGMVVYEGDRRLTGDRFEINSIDQSDGSAGSTTNFFNSRISSDGDILTNRGPAYVNSLGTEAKTFTTTSIPNNATSANLRFTSTGDVYFPAALTTQVDLFAPQIVGTKTVSNLTRGAGTAQVGDTLEYTLTYTNVGDDNATNAVIRDQLPANVTYVPGSIRVTGGSNQGVKTDAAGDDQGEYQAAQRQIRVRAGPGAGATSGGTLAKNAPQTITFRVTVDPTAAGTTISNTGLLDYTAPQIGKNFTYETGPATTPVAPRADLALTKAATPQPVAAGALLTYTLTATNNGPNTAVNASVADTLPSGVSLVSATPSSGTCGSTGQRVDCELGDIPNSQSRTVTITVRVLTGFVGSGLTNVASVASDTSDVVTGNDTASATSTVVRSADVSVAKSSAPANPVPGTDVTFTLDVSNAGPSNAAAVTVSDTIPAAFTNVRASTPGGGCTVDGNTVSCALGTVNAGAAPRTVTIVARLLSGYTGGPVDNTASVSSTTADPTNGNNTSTTTVTPAPASADLVVAKETVTSPVVPGRQVQYRVTVTNRGPSDSANVRLSDTPVSDLTDVSATPSQGTCTNAVLCSLGTVDAGSSATVTVSGTIDPTATGTLSNTASVVSDTTDPVPGNDSATVDDTLAPLADLNVDKVAPVALAGNNVTYTVTVTNNGISTARGIVLTDPVPAPLGVVSASSDQGDCTVAGTDVRCEIGTLDATEEAEITIVATTPSDGSADGVVNTASVTSDTPDPVDDNNEASHTLTQGAQANISLDKSEATPSPVIAGGPVSWTLTASNAGPSDASGIEIVDTIPDNVTIGTLPAGCTSVGQVVTCTQDTLSAGDDFQVTLSGTLSASTDPGALVNNATATAATPTDPSASDNDATSRTPVSASADLALAKSGPMTAVAGDVIAYEFTVSNNGPSDARGVEIIDQLPAGTTFVSSDECALQPDSTDTVACDLGTIAADDDATASVRVRVSSSVPTGTTLTNDAQVNADTDDPTAGNNDAAFDTAITTSADLSVTKVADPVRLVAGNEAVYTLTVTNDGPSDAQVIEVVDALPSGVSLVEATTDAGECLGTTTITCTRDSLAAGADWTVNIRVLVAPGTTAPQLNQASVSSDTPDPDGEGDSVELTSPVDVAGDLEIVKTTTPRPLVPGQQPTYTLTVINYGPATMTGTVVTDRLPAAFSNASATVDEGSCEVTGRDVECTLDPVTPNVPVVVTVTALLDATYEPTTITNTASVVSDTADLDEENNEAVLTTNVVPSADLQVVKRTNEETVVAGSPFDYTVEVTNLGPSVARGVVLEDVVPQDLSVLSATIVGGDDCDVDGRAVTCVLGAIGDAPSTVAIRVRPQSDVTGPQLTNTATVTSDTADPDDENNSGSVTVDVGTEADLTVDKTRTVPASGPVVPGQRVTWTVDVANLDGPSDARDVTVTDQVDPALTGVTATTPDGTCDVSDTNLVDCSLGTIGAGLAETVTISGVVPADFTGQLSNTATAGSVTLDPTPANTDTVNDDTEPASAVSVAKQRTSGPIVPGQPVGWVITVTNDGPSDATGVTIEDDVVDALTGVVATGPAGTTCDVATGNVVTCDLGTVGSAPVQIGITGTVPADFTGTLDNTATVDAPSDSTDGDDSATSEGEAQASADLAITKDRTSGPVVPGQTVTWQVGVDNLGPSVARNVSVTDDLVNDLRNVTASSAAGPCTVSDEPATLNEVVCELGAIAPDADPVVITISGLVPAGFSGDLDNTASVDSATPDPVGRNDSATSEGTAAPESDVSILKALTTAVVPGSEVTWRITVSNAGPSSASGATISDQVPAGLTDVSFEAAGDIDCALVAGVLECDLPTIAPRTSVEVLLTGMLPADFTGAVDNTATVDAPTDTTDDNNTSTVPGPAVPAADVSITKIRTSGTPVPGLPVTWEIEVGNAGPSVATDVTVTDDLIDGLENVIVTPASADCTLAAGNEISCDLGALDPDTAVTLTVTGDLPSDYTGSVDNTADVVSPVDSTDGNNSATVEGTAAPNSDVSIIKRRTSGVIVAGTPVSWNVVVTNNGPSVATGVTLADDLNDALDNVVLTPASADCDIADGNEISCDLGALDVDEAVTITITGDVPSDFTGNLDNTATVASPVDTTDDNNSATSPGDSLSFADLSIVKARTSGPVVPGQVITWTLTVDNAGPSNATEVSVTDDVNDAVTGLTATGPGGLVCDVSPTNQVECDLGTITPTAAPIVITLRGTVPADYTGAMSNTARVDSVPSDTNQADNTSTVDGTAVPAADVSIAKSRTSGTPVPGRPVTWEIEVSNAGPSVATDVTVTDDVLDELENATVTPASANCTIAAGNEISCDLDPLGATDTVTITVTGDLPADYTGAVDNSASVTTPTDNTPGNNTADVPGTAAPDADVSITKNRPSGTPVPGQPVTWTLTVENSGPSVATDVTVNDDLVDELENVVVTPAWADCTLAAGNVITCDVERLTVDEVVTLTVTGDLPADYTGDVSNSAGVDAPADTTPGNNTSTVPGSAQPLADLSLTKARTSGPVIPGQAVTWTVTVENTGPSDATDVTITDDVNDAVTGLTASGPAGTTCAVAVGNQVSCDLGTVVAGAAPVVITLVGDVPPAFTGDLSNSATVGSPTDVTPDNNTDNEPGTAQPEAAVSITKTRTSGVPVPGQSVTWDITVANAGPSDATGVSVTDDVLDALTGVTATGPTGVDCDVAAGNVVTCDLPAIGAGDTVSVTVTGGLPSGFTGSVANTAAVDAPDDTTPDDNTSTSPGTPVEARADLSIAKKLRGGAPVPGETVEWELVISNDGPSDARDVVVSDTVVNAVTDLGATGPGDTACAVSGQAISCEIEVLPAGQSLTIVVTGQLDPDFRGALTNAADVGSSAVDPDPTDNADATEDVAAPEADVAIAKEIEPARPNAGETVTFTLTASNDGPSTATDVTLSDPLDPRLDDVEITAPNATSCGLGPDQVVTCSIERIAVGEEVVVTITAVLAPDATGPLVNSVTVTPGPELDSNPDNDTDTVTTEPLGGRADLRVTKRALVDEVVAGGRLDYVVTVTNAGPAVARDVDVVDSLPAGLRAVSTAISPDAGQCRLGTEVRCRLGDLGVGDVVRITVTVEVGDDLRGKVVNQVEVASATADPVDGNNTGAAPVTVLAPDAGTGPDNGAGPDSDDDGGGLLPDTGLGAWLVPLLALGLLLLLLGLFLVRRALATEKS